MRDHVLRLAALALLLAAPASAHDGPASGDLDMNGYEITGCPAFSGVDLVAFYEQQQFSNATFLPLNGALPMIGNLNLNGYSIENGVYWNGIDVYEQLSNAPLEYLSRYGGIMAGNIVMPHGVNVVCQNFGVGHSTYCGFDPQQHIIDQCDAHGLMVCNDGFTVSDMLNDINMDGNDLLAPGEVDGRDVSADGAALDAHVASTSNPHSTTLTQAEAAGGSIAAGSIGSGTVSLARGGTGVSFSGAGSRFPYTNVSGTQMVGLDFSGVPAGKKSIVMVDNSVVPIPEMFTYDNQWLNVPLYTQDDEPASGPAEGFGVWVETDSPFGFYVRIWNGSSWVWVGPIVFAGS